jgi:hypothetical protein
MSLAASIQKRLEAMLADLRLHLDAHPAPESEEFDWEEWGRQWCLKEVRILSFERRIDAMRWL